MYWLASIQVLTSVFTKTMASNLPLQALRGHITILYGFILACLNVSDLVMPTETFCVILVYNMSPH